jgi:hypothetical protein
MFGDPTVPAGIQSAVIQGKRIVDSARVYVIISWVGLLFMIYPYVCLALINIEHKEITTIQVADYPGLEKAWKPALGFVTIAVIAMAFAFSKVYR